MATAAGFAAVAAALAGASTWPGVVLHHLACSLAEHKSLVQAERQRVVTVSDCGLNLV
jgi:hypothetical protein